MQCMQLVTFFFKWYIYPWTLFFLILYRWMMELAFAQMKLLALQKCLKTDDIVCTIYHIDTEYVNSFVYLYIHVTFKHFFKTFFFNASININARPLKYYSVSNNFLYSTLKCWGIEYFYPFYISLHTFFYPPKHFKYYCIVFTN